MTKKSGIQALTSARSIQQAKRQAEIMQLRIQGLTLRQIADNLKIDVATVHGIISRALTAVTKEPREELLALELGRCDTLLNEAMETVKAFHPMLYSGTVVSVPLLSADGELIRNPQTGEVLTRVLEDKAPKLAAIAAAVRVLERRAKLLGLDAPVRSTQQIQLTETEPADLSHLSLEELEEIKSRLYPTQNLPINYTPIGTIQ